MAGNNTGSSSQSSGDQGGFFDPETLPTTNHPPVRKASKTNPKNDSVMKPQQTENKKEIGGRGGEEPTRYGDWEKNGRCVDF